MLCYLNRGLILEQAIRSLIDDYFKILNLQNVYKNFHIRVTNEHPFAALYLDNSLNAADSFPCVVVSTQEDMKPNEFSELPPQVEGVGITVDDLKIITQTKETVIKEDGTEKQLEIPGLCTVINEEALLAINEVIERQTFCYGFSCRTRKKDTISIEIWSENIQLKSELYEQIRLFATGNLRHLLQEKYPFFDTAISDDTVTGHRSNNFNFDFDVALSGAHISLDVQYCVEQIVLNTDLVGISSEIITEVINYVKD